jgi:hypothetical protein
MARRADSASGSGDGSDGGGDSSVDLSLLSEGSSDEGEEAQGRVPAAGAGDADAADGAGPSGSGGEGGGGEGSDGGPAAAKPPKKKASKVLSRARLQRLQDKAARRGIVYVSRIPPHMKPAKLRQLLGQYGEIGRVYCTPEDAAARRKRKQHGGNTGARARARRRPGRRAGRGGGGGPPTGCWRGQRDRVAALTLTSTDRPLHPAPPAQARTSRRAG